jgi:hypothetical protein
VGQRKRKYLTVEQVCWWWAGGKCVKNMRGVRLLLMNKVRLGTFPKPSRKLRGSNITLWSLGDLRTWLLEEHRRLCGLRDRLIAWDREDDYGWWSDRAEGVADPAGDQQAGGVRGDPPGKAAPGSGAD